jgi:hypothetical protein
LFGLLSLVSGVGLFLLKNWARILWLGVLILLAVMNLYWLISEYRRDTFDAGNFVVYSVIGIVIIGMWLYFNNRKTKIFSTERGGKCRLTIQWT